ncbi:phosphoserine phosphatase SerB [Agaribacterium sp. ZY112]|uniref:phosphoserine phosphatase SerB n=1 Tax=Agaribacterium sp. ZY112 TaxID=3233574 RepID=UPI0035238AF5
MRELLLISLSGRDKPALTSQITSLLAEANAVILDIGQAVIHENLNLGMLVELPDADHSGDVVKKVLFCAHELDMQVRFQPVDEDSYEEWTGLQGKRRHIITLLARQISAEQIGELTRIIAEHNLNIDNISRLSGRVPIDAHSGSACVEFTARGHVEDQAELRAQFAELASRLDVDIAFQEDNMFRRTRRLVCFDMDSTLIETEVIDELAKAAGVGDQVIAITEAAMRGELDFQQSFRERVALLKGLDESVLEGIAERLPVTEGAERLISTLSKLGYKTAILSGGFNYFGRYLQNKLGIDYVYANDLDIVDGKVTGEVNTQIVDGQRKADLLRELADKEQISLKQVVAVGDGANDLPMLSIAGLGIAFRAKPLVRAEAKNAISNLGLDAILYLMGFRDREISHSK